jgi:PAS domain S-box-containing protein
MKNSLERRILIFSLLALTLTIVVNTAFHVASFRSSYRDSILQRAQTFAMGMKAQVEAVVNLGLSLDEMTGVSERCQEIVDNDPELSYCLVEDSTGQVLFYSSTEYPVTANADYVGTLSSDVSVLEDEVLGKVYDYAAPVYDFDDQVAGRVRMGFRDEVLGQMVMDHFGSTILVLAAAFIVTFGVIVLFSRRDLVLPIRRLCRMAEDLAAGQFDTDAPYLKTRELAMLGDTLTKMAESLRERDEELSRNYKEIEETNRELQASYENLESISSALGRSREMYRSLLDDASDAILVCDEEDNLVIANKASESFFGLPKSAMEENNYFSFLERIKCQRFEEFYELHQNLQPGVPSVKGLRFYRKKDDRGLVGQATTTAIVDKEGRRLVQIVVRDVTAEEEIRQGLERTAKEMERLGQMKNSFLGLASHELKTPLTIIMGYVELLLTERAESFDEETLDLIKHVSRASERLAEIVRDMVDVSQIDGKTIDLVSQDVDINTLVQRAAEKMSSYTEQRAQKLEFDLAKDLPLVRCDVERMTQALVNIIGNAVKFTPDKGKIQLYTQLVQYARAKERFAASGISGACALNTEQIPYVQIVCSDEGIGIAPEEQEAIFDKFHEVGNVEEHSTGKIAFKSRGTGLGLSIVKGVVELHGGTVWVESPGYDPEAMPGSTFYILLPAKDTEV